MQKYRTASIVESDADLKILLKLEGDEFRVAKIDVTHKYDVVKGGEKRVLRPNFDDNAATTIIDILLSAFNANVQQFQTQSPQDPSPCLAVYTQCAKIMLLEKRLLAGCRCDCVWDDGVWFAYVRCGQDVG